jgi:hypothetical protein
MKKVFSAILLSLTLVTSCDGIISLSSDVFSSANLTIYEQELTPDVPYVSENYQLPELSTNPFLLDVIWSTPTYPIEENELIYVSPMTDETIVLSATLTYQTLSHVFTFDILVKSQLHVPTFLKRPRLSIVLANQRTETDIYYEDYISASAVIQHDKHGNYQTTTITSPLGIRTRGHSTRFMPKRPYRIRFDENTSLFGMKEAKNYILLANYLDRSMVRNSLVAFMSQSFGETLYALDYRFVDLVINQEYRGQYLLIERVEFQKNRLDIEPNLTLDDAGFMIELDFQVYVQNQGNEDLEWFKMNDKPYVIKEPNPLTTQGYQFRHTRYMNDYFHATRTALIQKTNYAQYIDVENWIDYFMIQEIAKNVDVGWGSVYMVKPSGETLKHMPLWDFDLAFGNADYIDYGPEGHWGWATYEKNELFTLMMGITSIRNRFKEKLIAFERDVLPGIMDWLSTNETALTTLSQPNFQLWPMDTCEGWCPIPQPLQGLTSISQQFDYLRDFLTQRITWMKTHI